ncbi:MAG: hypothetical protein CVU41_01970 [Chloroflexi bacterium HGW-Chloroflexi-3]|nr:MAG: hypothetical protein CVU41_01970 [Chloroflexi bacterium HGW-Chloroflexi-3]
MQALGRVINPDSSGKERTKLTKSIVKAIRQLMTQTQPDQNTRDLAAFIVLGLEDIYKSIDISVLAWEKRGYWVKADRFRIDWEWTLQFSKQMREALLKEDWAQVALMAAKTAQKFNNVKIPVNNRIGEPWIGAFKNL